MAVISLKKIKEVVEKSKEAYALDLGKFVDPSLEGIIIPIKVKTYEEALAIKTNFKLKSENLTIKYEVFRKAPKSFRDWYGSQIDVNRKNVPTWVQICEVSKDLSKIDIMRFRERLFDVIIHIDMDAVTEEGTTLWEESGVARGDYNGLVQFFSNVIKFEEHLNSLEIVIDELKNGTKDDATLIARLYLRRMYLQIAKIEDKVERENALEDFQEKLMEAHESFNKGTEQEQEVEKNV